MKNKIAPPYGTGVSVLTFNQGINIPAEMMEVGVEYGVITKPNNRTYIEAETGQVIGKSKAEALESLKQDEALIKRLTEAVKKHLAKNLYGIEDDEVVVEVEP